MSDSRRLSIGIASHSNFGGSVVVATELGMALAERGHEVHYFSSQVPPRLDVNAPLITFHQVKSPEHPLFPSGEQAIALSSKIIEVAHSARLDVMHVHYGIPHAISAFLAQQVLGERAPRVVTTLHGTDVLTLGVDPAFFTTLRHAIVQSDAVTVPSQYLKGMAEKNFAWPSSRGSIQVIGNSVDVHRFRPVAAKNWERLAALLPNASFTPMPKVLTHNSNFRPLKRIDDVVKVFAKVRAQVPAVLLLIGDGPERAAITQQVASLGLTDSVSFVGEQDDVQWLLQSSDVFILPSQTESFGLAALEALSCGVPVVATSTGGLPELIKDGVTGSLHRVGDAGAMASSVTRLFTDEGLRARWSAAARASVEEKWQRGPMVDRYEAVYRSTR